MSEVTLRIDGMHCGSCVRRATQALQKVPGTQVEEVRIGAARVNFSGEAAVLDQLIESLRKAGLPAHVE